MSDACMRRLSMIAALLLLCLRGAGICVQALGVHGSVLWCVCVRVCVLIRMQKPALYRRNHPFVELLQL